jgi:hypothetical protein
MARLAELTHFCLFIDGRAQLDPVCPIGQQSALRSTRESPVRHLPTLLCVIASLTGSQAWGQDRFVVLSHGSSGGVGTISPTDLSADGRTVVGTTSLVDGGRTRTASFRWSPDDGMSLLPDQSNFPVLTLISEPAGVSADGSVIVGRINTDWDPDECPSFDGCFHPQSFRWTLTGGFARRSEQRTFAVSDDGQISVSCDWDGNLDQPEYWPLRRDEGPPASWDWLFNEPGFPGDGECRPMVMSPDGATIVADWMPPAPRYYVWRSGVLAELGFMPSALSEDGSVMVGGDLQGAYRWTEAGGREGLGGGRATVVSADGEILAGAESNQAFIWGRSGGRRDLKALLEGTTGIDLSGWQLRSVTGMSADGTRLTGTGLDPLGQPQGWYASLPACADARDQDGDGAADFPDDPGCLHPAALVEDPQCQNGIDDDGDGAIDFDGGESANGGAPLADPDPECLTSFQDSETGGGCGLGVELLGVPLLLRVAHRRLATGRSAPVS